MAAVNQQVLAALAAAAGGVSWVTTFSTTLVSDQGGWGSTNQRQLLPASLLSTSGSQVRLTMKAASGASCSIDGCYIGHKASSGDDYDFDGGQVQILVGASSSWTIGANGTTVSDAATFALDETKDLVIAIHYTGTSSILGGGPSGAVNYYKVAANDTATTNATGYSLDSINVCRLIQKIEVA